MGAERERILLIQRTRDGVSRSQEQGVYFGRLPLGFKRENKRLVLDDTGNKVLEMLNLNPKLKPSYVQKELGLKYKDAWSMITNVKNKFEN